MDHDVDLGVVKPEQVVGLDDLEPFVHERRRVDRDLRAHGPRGMRERLLHRRQGQLFPAPSQERPAGTRDDHAAEVIAALPTQALRQRGVLRVDGHKPLRLSLDQVHDQLAPDDERLLVGERQGLPGLEGGQGGAQPDRADHGVQDHVGVDLTSHELRGLRPGQHLDRAQATELRGDLTCRFLLGHRHDLRHELADLAHEQLVAGPRRERDHLEPVGVAPGHVKSLRSDRAGRSQDGDLPHRHSRVLRATDVAGEEGWIRRRS